LHAAVALREIRRYQRNFDLLLLKLPFSRLCREVLSSVAELSGINRMQAAALGALQEATEAYIVGFLEGKVFPSLINLQYTKNYRLQHECYSC